MKATTAFGTNGMQRSRQTSHPHLTRFCGVDGCKTGWIALLCAEDFSNVEWRLARSWTELNLQDCAVAVDMPIGLATAGRRGCDEAARAVLRARRSSVFSMPVRGALDFATYAEANAWSKAEGHGGIVKQAWNLRSKVLEVEHAVLAAPQSAIFESHPELAFARLGRTVLPPKKSALGQAARLRRLSRAGILGLREILAAVPPACAGADDVLDAAVLMLSAVRIAQGKADVYPTQPIVNGQGLEMAIRV